MSTDSVPPVAKVRCNHKVQSQGAIRQSYTHLTNTSQLLWNQGRASATPQQGAPACKAQLQSAVSLQLLIPAHFSEPSKMRSLPTK
jgi:hypothetical protein